MAGSPGVPPAAPPAAADKSKAACDYIVESLTGLTNLKAAVCAGAGPILAVDPKIASDALLKKIQDMLEKIKTDNKGHPETNTIDAFKADQDALHPFEVSIKSVAGSNAMSDSTTLDDIKGIILAELTDKKTPLNGGRRGKRSARRSRRNSKGGRRSRKGGKSHKGRKSRGRSNKSKGGAKMGKELKAWMKRQQKATGIPPISKATIAATKTNPQSTGSAQRSESSKHVAAQSRGLNSSSS